MKRLVLASLLFVHACSFPATDPNVALASSQETEARADDKAPPILIEVDEITKARLEPWFEEYFAENEGPTPVTEYGFFLFDDVVVQNILSSGGDCSC